MSLRTKSVLKEVERERVNQLEKHGDPMLPLGTGPGRIFFDLPVNEHGTATAEDLVAWAKRRKRAASIQYGNGTVTFEHVLTEEFTEVISEDNPVKLRHELIQLAAVAVAMVETMDLIDSAARYVK